MRGEYIGRDIIVPSPYAQQLAAIASMEPLAHFGCYLAAIHSFCQHVPNRNPKWLEQLQQAIEMGDPDDNHRIVISHLIELALDKVPLELGLARCERLIGYQNLGVEIPWTI